MKIAIYARYSSDNQRDASIADQLRICREFAVRQGWTISQEFTDHAISGATLLRSGFQALMRDALNRRFDVVLAESLDRFSRDQEDTAGLFKRLTFAGVNIVTFAEGDIMHLHIGFKGTMNALFLKDLAEKTHRGLRGRVESGKAGGGLCYGYRVVRMMAGTTVTTGEREIGPTEAAIVQRIFREFIAGHSPKQIAKMLNGEGILGSLRWEVEPEYDSRQPEAGHWHSEQRALHRPHGLESTALREESGHRQARVEAEPFLGVDHDGRSALADRSGRTMVGGEGAPEAHSTRDRGDWQAGNGEPSALPVLGTDEMRCVWRGVHHRLRESAHVLRRERPGHLLESADHST
jgi:site-specific DNA recombinase